MPRRPHRLFEQHGNAGGDLRGEFGIGAGAEDGGGLRVGVDAGDVVGGEGEAALRLAEMGRVGREEGASRLSRLPSDGKRSEQRSVGTAGVRTSSSQWTPSLNKTKHNHIIQNTAK